MVPIIMVDSQLAKGFPYSRAIRVGNLVFTHGQTGRDSQTGRLVSGGIEPETCKSIEQLSAILEKAGALLKSVVKVTAYLADLSEYDEFNKAYLSYFLEHQPARTVVQASGLHDGARVEMDMIAYVGESDEKV